MRRPFARLAVSRANILGAFLLVLGFAAPPVAARASTLEEIAVPSAALGRPLSVSIYRPDGPPPSDGWPVLYLLHGLNGSYRDWPALGGIQATLDRLIAARRIRPLVVVMPDAGNSWYVNSSAVGGPGDFQTAILDDLPRAIEQDLPARHDRGARAIAGLSMGGFGAFSYAARHPDLFAIAASFSGAIDTNDPQPAGQPDESILDGGVPDSTWGPYQTQQVIWRAHDPWDLAANLRGLDLMMLTGNGLPGGPYPWEPATGAIEYDIHQQNVDMNARLDALGIPHYYDDYGAGDHSWPYWQRDLSQVLPMIIADFAHPPAAPKAVTFTAAESSYDVYGWTVSLTRPVMEFSTLEHASARGFALAGSGTATVSTPPEFTRGRRYLVTVTPQSGAQTRVRVRPGPSRRLRIPVPIGPPNEFDEYTPGATTTVYTTQVTIRPEPRR
jgi:S-formylglutathione hydrolase FrmB